MSPDSVFVAVTGRAVSAWTVPCYHCPAHGIDLRVTPVAFSENCHACCFCEMIARKAPYPWAKILLQNKDTDEGKLHR